MLSTVSSVALPVVGVVLLAAVVVRLLLRDVPAGQIRLVTWFQGSSRLYRGPAKSKELAWLTTSTLISSTPLTVDVDLTDQTADADAAGTRRPIEVRVLATAIVSVGDEETMIRTAATTFCAKSETDQAATLRDLLGAAGRRALNALRHDELFAAPRADGALQEAPAGPAAEAHPFAVMMRKASAGDLADLGLLLRSFHIRSVSSPVVEALRRQAAAEAQASADVAVTAFARRSREAQLETDRAISDRERELEQARAENASLVAQAKAKQQEIEAQTNAQRVRAEASAAQEALRGAQFGLALDEALRITKIAAAQADGFRKVNDTIREGGDSYFRYRLIEMLPKLTPAIAQALTNANLVGSTGSGNGTTVATDGVSEVIQTALAGQLASVEGIIEPPNDRRPGRGNNRVTIRKRQQE